MKSVLRCILMLVPSAALLAQSFPAGTEGNWKIKEQYPKKTIVKATTCDANPAFFSKDARGTIVTIRDGKLVWERHSNDDPQPKQRTMNIEEFNTTYGQAGVSAITLGLPERGIQLMELGNRGDLPFDTIVVKDPSTLYFGRCGLFMKGVHSGGFVAPPLPSQDR